jgi:hypothetical protein
VISTSWRRLFYAALGLAGVYMLTACAAPNGTATAATGTPSEQWTEDTLIQPNGLLPNGLRPFRYFYW